MKVLQKEKHRAETERMRMFLFASSFIYFCFKFSIKINKVQLCKFSRLKFATNMT